MNLFLPIIFLAIVQAIAEFLPISSSGHLLIMQRLDLFGTSLADYNEETSLFLNVALHIATLAAIIIYLRKDIWEILSGGCRELVSKNFAGTNLLTLRNIILATIPAGAAGVFAGDFFTSIYSNLMLVFLFLIINGFVLITTKIIPLNTRKIEEMGIIRSIAVGLFQAAAILPGISRSGMTITGGFIAGLTPNDAARFSFLMAVPVIGGAGLLEARKLFIGSIPHELLPPLCIAMVIAAVIALAAMKLLFELVRKVRIDVFGYYTILVGTAGIVWLTLQ